MTESIPASSADQTPAGVRRIRVVLAKIGLDGHDRGVQVVARALRDAGMEVIYTGLWQDPRAVIRAVEDEDADVLGISILSGAHMTLVPVLFELLKERGLDSVVVIIGGIIPKTDIPPLESMGVAHVFTPGSSLDEICDYLKRTVRRGGDVSPPP